MQDIRKGVQLRYLKHAICLVLLQAGDDYSYIMAEALADRLAEALAERLHEVSEGQTRDGGVVGNLNECAAQAELL
jgi:cobalamin-dependent methionine synthase I